VVPALARAEPRRPGLLLPKAPACMSRRLRLDVEVAVEGSGASGGLGGATVDAASDGRVRDGRRLGPAVATWSLPPPPPLLLLLLVVVVVEVLPLLLSCPGPLPPVPVVRERRFTGMPSTTPYFLYAVLAQMWLLEACRA